MKNLEKRVASLESRNLAADIKTMTDDELDAYIETLEIGSLARNKAIVASLMRHPAPFPIVEDEPDDFVSKN
jgi:hypothetical protein